MIDKEKRLAQVREAKRTYRLKMRAAGFREIIVWVTPMQEKLIREIVKDNTTPPSDTG
ncbi:hypothetical protein [Acidithiobacillus sp.]